MSRLAPSFSGVSLRPLLAKRFVGRRLGGMSACGARRMTKPQGGLGMMSSAGGGIDVISGPPPQALVRIDALGAICCGSHGVDPQPGFLARSASGVQNRCSLVAGAGLVRKRRCLRTLRHIVRSHVALRCCSSGRQGGLDKPDANTDTRCHRTGVCLLTRSQCPCQSCAPCRRKLFPAITPRPADRLP